MILIYKYITVQQHTTEPEAGSDEYSPQSQALFLLDKNIPLLCLGLSNELLPSSNFIYNFVCILCFFHECYVLHPAHPA